MKQTVFKKSIPQVSFYDFCLACIKSHGILDSFLYLTKFKGKVFFVCLNPLARKVPPILFISEPKLIEEILTHNDVFVKTRRGQAASPVFGNNFMADSEGKYCQPKRGIVKQAILANNQFEQIQEKIAQVTSECLTLYKDGDILELQSELKRIVMYGICKTLIGGEGSELTADFSLAEKLGMLVEGVIRSYAAISQTKTFSLPLILRPFQQRLEQEGQQLHECLHYLIESGAKGPLVDAANAIDPTDPLSSLAELTMLAYYNTSITLCQLFARLLQYKQNVYSLQAELDSTVDTQPKTLAQLPLLNGYIQECLRLHPPQSIFGRTTRSDYETNEVSIPAGTSIVISPYVLHRLPEFWQEPELFRPERFQEFKPVPFTYLPFSHGARACVGREFAMMHIRQIVAQIISRYAIESIPSTKEHRPKKFRYQPFARQPLLVRLQYRVAAPSNSYLLPSSLH